jgi:DNA repair exonuclease SbcCD ATPase subunit
MMRVHSFTSFCFVGKKSEDATTCSKVNDENLENVEEFGIYIERKSDFTESESSKIERLENELRIAKELIQSLKAERKKLRSDKNDLLQQVKHLCASLQEREQELRNFIRKFDQRIKDEGTAAKATSDSEHDRWTLIKQAQDETERSLTLAAQLNLKEIQLQRMEQKLRQLSGEGISEDVGISPSSGAVGLLNYGCDEGESSGMVSAEVIVNFAIIF